MKKIIFIATLIFLNLSTYATFSIESNNGLLIQESSLAFNTELEMAYITSNNIILEFGSCYHSKDFIISNKMLTSAEQIHLGIGYDCILPKSLFLKYLFEGGFSFYNTGYTTIFSKLKLAINKLYYMYTYGIGISVGLEGNNLITFCYISGGIKI